jgi:hypothetical protein
MPALGIATKILFCLEKIEVESPTLSLLESGTPKTL